MPNTISRRAVLAGMACGAASTVIGRPALAAAPAQLTSFRSTSKSWLWAPEDYGIAKGFFKVQNLEVTVVATEKAPNIDALLSRAADIVLTPPDQAMRVQMQGQPVKLIAGMVNKYASNIIVRASLMGERGVTLLSPVAERVAALKGLKLATTGAGGAPDSLFRFLLCEHGLDPEKDVQLVPVRGGGAAMLAAFKQGAVDGFGLSSPTSDLAVAKFEGAYLFDMATAPPPFFEDFLYIAVATSDRLIKERPADLVAYYRGLNQSLISISQDPASFEQWAREFFPDLEATLFARAFANNSKIYMNNPRITTDQFLRNIEFMHKQTLAKRDPRIPDGFAFTNVVDQQIADASDKK